MLLGCVEGFGGALGSDSVGEEGGVISQISLVVVYDISQDSYCWRGGEEEDGVIRRRMDDWDG